MVFSIGLVALAASFAVASPVLEPGQSLYEPPAQLASCPLNPSQSCKNNTLQTNLCCFEAPNGLLAQTQFWDTHPPVGPPNSWTIHGLFVDRCDASWDEACDDLRAYPSPRSIMQRAHREDLIDFMEKFWLSNSLTKDPRSIWKHEWDKHGTCMSTLRDVCMPRGSPTGTDALHYFDRTVSLFKTLKTYEWLKAAGIEPSETDTHTLAELQDAIRDTFGHTVGFDCKNKAVFQVYYYFNLKGSAVDGTFVPVDAPKPGSCPRRGIKYLPKPGRRRISEAPETSETAGTFRFIGHLQRILRSVWEQL